MLINRNATYQSLPVHHQQFIKMLYKTSVRNLWKNRSHSLINVLGLSIGITCSILLFLLIRFWLSFDTFHANADRIYRLLRETTYQGNTDHTPGTPVPAIEALRNDFPEIEEVLFMSYFREGLVTVENQTGKARNFEESTGLVYVDANYFKVLDRPLLLGEAAQALDSPNEVVIDETLAAKYFGPDWQQQSILGKTIMLNKETELKITAVAEAAPENTDFPFSMLISYATVQKDMEADGGWGSVDSDNQIYVLLPEGISAEQMESRLPAYVDKYEDLLEGQQLKLSLQPLSDIHYDIRYSGFAFNNVPRYVIHSLGLVALFMLLIACINFINLATAIAGKRAREVGIRKTLGSSKSQLARIFLAEAALITLISLLIALCAAELLLIRMNDFLELNLQLDLLTDPQLSWFLLLLLVGVSLLSGSYPAWVLTRFEPARVLKVSREIGKNKGMNLRRGLVIFQFVIAQAFIIGTLVLLSQLRFVQEADLGFRQDGILSVPLPNDAGDLKKTFKQELLRLAEVQKASLNFSSPTSGNVSVTSFEIDEDDNIYQTQLKFVDKDYLDVYDIQLLAGVGMTETDTMSRLVVNEAFVRKVGLQQAEEALGRQVTLWGKTLPVVGVVEDFHTMSLSHPLEPVALVDLNNFEKVDVLLGSANVSRAIGKIESVWQTTFPDYTFQYQFVEEEVGEFNEGFERMTVIISIASLIVIFIGCLGLYGLVTYMAEQKTKEVGVRKTLGASVGSILGLFSREFVRLILIAFVMAAPIAYLLMSAWLENFAYKIDLGVGLFAAGILITLLVALSTISYRSLQAAHTNPAKVLRND
jgi:ABC-type antimicrobial peptide transport system permease subunit